MLEGFDPVLRSLSIRNFVVVESLDVDFDPAFSVLTGETGAGKSILLEALGLLLGDRFELRELRPGAERAELVAEFDVSDVPGARAWLAEQELSAEDTLLLRRVLDAQGRSRAWINGTAATLAQLAALGERLVALHGQHAHQTLASAEAQRELIDAFGGFTTLTQQVGEAWRAWRAAVETRDAAAKAAGATAAEREYLESRRRELTALAVTEGEWAELGAVQSRLAHAASLIEVATEGEDVLAEGEGALAPRLAQLQQHLEGMVAHDPALKDIVALLEPAAIQMAEAARALRDYRRHLDLDPGELARIEERMAAIHAVARKHRVPPETLPTLLAETEARISALEEAADAELLSRRAAAQEREYRALAETLSKKRRFAANELAHRATATMQELAMAGGRMEIELNAVAAPASYGLEQVEFRIATHPKLPLEPLARVASGGELSRIALAIAVVTSEVGQVPTLVFDEVDTGIGGAVAATVGRLLQTLGARRQVLCVTHLPQVAAHADQHFRVEKISARGAPSSTLSRFKGNERVDELARMLSGSEITSKTRAHAKELYEQHKRK